jgi:hypothetical protein
MHVFNFQLYQSAAQLAIDTDGLQLVLFALLQASQPILRDVINASGGCGRYGRSVVQLGCTLARSLAMCVRSKQNRYEEMLNFTTSSDTFAFRTPARTHLATLQYRMPLSITRLPVGCVPTSRSCFLLESLESQQHQCVRADPERDKPEALA